MLKDSWIQSRFIGWLGKLAVGFHQFSGRASFPRVRISLVVACFGNGRFGHDILLYGLTFGRCDPTYVHERPKTRSRAVARTVFSRDSLSNSVYVTISPAPS